MAQNDTSTLAPGIVIVGEHRYVIERVLGAGGFGITYLASTHVTMGNITFKGQVAIKEHFMGLYNERDVASGAVTTPGTAKARELVGNAIKDFLGEARRLQRLGAGHPNIVKVNEVFEANGTAYYVMEYLDGSSLWDNIKGRGMTEPDMLALMLPIVDAVAYLHRNRLTHLDIKPQNIMLAAGEGGAVRPVLIDFGLSKHYDAEGHATSTINTLACSDGYSPAEQYSGIMTFTPSADVYALGATMIACLTGKTPPKSTEWTAGERMRYIDTLPVSEPLRAALRGALADTSQRLPDASALASTLMSANATRQPEGRFLSKESASRLSTAGQAEASISDYDNATRPMGADPSTPDVDELEDAPSGKKRRSIILIALAAIALGIGIYFVLPRGSVDTTPVTADTLAIVADTLTIAQTLETEPVEIETPAPEPQPTPQVTPAPTPQPTPVPQPAPQHQQEETPVQGQSNSVWQNHRTPRNLYLAVNRGGNQYYFSESDWNALPAAQKGECSKLGVVINKDGERFILTLEDAPGFYTWQDAMNRFGNRLPTKQQGEAWISQQWAVQPAIRAFGGHITGIGVDDNNYPSNDSRHYYRYWTRTPFESNSSCAWYVTMYVGTMGYSSKSSAYRVRVVAPVSVSSAI